MRATGQGPHVPVGRHPSDGALLFAPLGVLRSTDAGSRVICHGCGTLLQALSRDHLRRHGWTPQQYRDRFSLAARSPLLSPKVRQQRQREAVLRHDVGGALAPHASVRAVANAASARSARLAGAQALGHATVSGYLRDAYEGRRLTVHEISRELGCSTRTTRTELALADVVLRPARRGARTAVPAPALVS